MVRKELAFNEDDILREEDFVFLDEFVWEEMRGRKRIKVEVACLLYSALELKVLIVGLICAGIKTLDNRAL